MPCSVVTGAPIDFFAASGGSRNLIVTGLVGAVCTRPALLLRLVMFSGPLTPFIKLPTLQTVASHCMLQQVEDRTGRCNT